MMGIMDGGRSRVEGSMAQCLDKGSDTQEPSLPARGAATKPDRRFAAWHRETEEDGWPAAEPTPPLRMVVKVVCLDQPQSV